jgi:hypothetical protein
MKLLKENLIEQKKQWYNMIQDKEKENKEKKIFEALEKKILEERIQELEQQFLPINDLKKQQQLQPINNKDCTSNNQSTVTTRTISATKAIQTNDDIIVNDKEDNNAVLLLLRKEIEQLTHELELSKQLEKIKKSEAKNAQENMLKYRKEVEFLKKEMVQLKQLKHQQEENLDPFLFKQEENKTNKKDVHSKKILERLFRVVQRCTEQKMNGLKEQVTFFNNSQKSHTKNIQEVVKALTMCLQFVVVDTKQDQVVQETLEKAVQQLEKLVQEVE